ncbi:MAG: hypothetical protein H6865_02875 [Rhodospirillales bacterium]|nr:hypothetical protein [Alphaproteobacteria bacterium]MCB9986560.1 hypothetical protein [Rhodospirillales bacterium]USO06907.1 MAG: hypothetical protein H6866_05510 [Rhodospirillales bacterium]
MAATLTTAISDIFCDFADNVAPCDWLCMEKGIKALAADGLPDLKSCVVTCEGDISKAQIVVSIAGNGYSDRYYIDPVKKSVLRGTMFNDRRDRHTGRRMFANRAIVGQALGATRLEGYAADTMGAYVWARAGMLPKSSQDGLPGMLAARAAILAPLLTPDQNEAIRKLSRLDDLEDLWCLADLGALAPVSEADFDTALDHTYSIGNHAYFKNEGFFKNGVTMGQFMLCGLSYDAVFDFANSRQMDRVEAYTGVPIRERALALRRKPAHAARLVP